MFDFDMPPTSTPQRHHHVPRFLLSGWCRKDGKLAIYSRVGNHVAVSFRAPKHTAFEPHLYSISSLPEADRQWVEREVMSRAVDSPAAKVLTRLRSGELGSLDSDERSPWTRFLMAQWLRSPEIIAKLRNEGRAALWRALEANPAEYLAAKGDSPHGTLTEWVEANAKGLDEIVAMGRVLPRLVSDAGVGSIIINMLWQVLHLNGSKVDLLTSDRPVLRFDGLKSNKCLIAAPLAPDLLFVASHYDRGFERHSPEIIARMANTSMVQAAHSRVYGTGSQHKPLVQKWLGHSAVG